MGLLETFIEQVTQGQEAPRDQYRGYPGLEALVEAHRPNFKHLNMVAHDLTYPVVQVESIVVWEDRRQQGHGEAFLKALCLWADQNGVRLALTPSASYGGKITRLKRWYARHGFKRNTGKHACYELMHSYVRPPFYLEGGPRKGYSCFGMPSVPEFMGKVWDEIVTSNSHGERNTAFRPFHGWEERMGAMVCTCGQPSELVSYSTKISGRIVRCRACHERTGRISQE